MFPLRLRALTLVCLCALMVVPAAARSDEVAAAPGIKGELMAWISDAEDKLLQLADATPEKKFAYRPGKDVRSQGEVFLHVAAANYGVPSFWGVKPPAGFDFPNYEKQKAGKAEVTTMLRESFAHMKGSLASASDADLEKPIEMFGMKTSVRGAYVLLLSHAHEHLGQTIAYARTNGIVPPWTAKQQEAMKAAEKAATK